MEEEILKLTGKAADAFIRYDKRKPTSKEIKENKEARNYYLSHCKSK